MFVLALCRYFFALNHRAAGKSRAEPSTDPIATHPRKVFSSFFTTTIAEEMSKESEMKEKREKKPRNHRSNETESEPG